MKAHRSALLATVVSLTVASCAGAQTIYNWNAPSPGNGSFGAQLFWTPTGPPGTTGEARFNSANSTYTVTFTTDPTNFRTRIGNDHVTFNLGGHTYTLTATDTSSPSIMVAGSTFVDDALLTITNGTLAGQHAVIAPAIFQTAAGMVVDTGGTLNLAGTFTVGKQLPGSLTIQNGGDVLSATGVLGESGAGDGSVTVTGLGSTWTNSGSVYVGGQAAIDGGSGTLSITNQGLVDIGGALKLWPGGNVALDGGKLKTADLELAGGSFNWTSGTLRFSSDLSVEPSGPLGDSIAVGAGKELGTDAGLYVGKTGNGSIDIMDGGFVGSASGCVIGNSTSSNGHVAVDGEGSSLYGGALSIGVFGHGTLDVTNGGVAGTGIANFMQSKDVFMAFSPGSTGAVNVDGENSLLSIGGRIIVGNRGTATLNITGGGHVNSFERAELGFTGTGIVTVDGPGSTWNVGTMGSKDLYIGGGSGTLNITGGGLVRSATVSMITPAMVTVDGFGSRWVNSEFLYIGASTSLTITNGGVVEAAEIITYTDSEIHGDGNISGNLQNGGLVSPSVSSGALTIDGDYTQTAGGELLIELASVGYAQLLVTGNATLAGTLKVSLIGDYAPSAGQSFDILGWSGTLTGTFATLNLPGLTGNLAWNTTALYTSGVISVVLPGDYNNNGTVDAADYVLWRKNDGTPVGYDTWRSHFGQTAGSGSGTIANAAVPEPAALILLTLAATYWCLRRCRAA